MKFTKKLAAISIAALALLGTTACSNKSSSNNSSSSAKVATKITKKTTVVFWHGMTDRQGLCGCTETPYYANGFGVDTSLSKCKTACRSPRRFFQRQPSEIYSTVRYGRLRRGYHVIHAV